MTYEHVWCGSETALLLNEAFVVDVWLMNVRLQLSSGDLQESLGHSMLPNVQLCEHLSKQKSRRQPI